MHYDPDGCYDLEEYIAVVNIGNKFQEYSNFIGYLMMMVGAFGIIGNSLSIIVLIRKKKLCFNYLLVALNCFDTLHIVFAILDVIRNNHEEAYPDIFLITFPYFHYPLYRCLHYFKLRKYQLSIRFSLCVSCYLIVAITCERYIAVSKPTAR